MQAFEGESHELDNADHGQGLSWDDYQARSATEFWSSLNRELRQKGIIGAIKLG